MNEANKYLVIQRVSKRFQARLESRGESLCNLQTARSYLDSMATLIALVDTYGEDMILDLCESLIESFPVKATKQKQKQKEE